MKTKIKINSDHEFGFDCDLTVEDLKNYKEVILSNLSNKIDEIIKTESSKKLDDLCKSKLQELQECNKNGKIDWDKYNQILNEIEDIKRSLTNPICTLHYEVEDRFFGFIADGDLKTELDGDSFTANVPGIGVFHVSTKRFPCRITTPRFRITFSRS